MSRRALLRVAKKLARPPKGVPVQPHSLPSELAHVALWFHALSDVTRVNIVQMLSYRERCVGELEQILDVPQPLLSSKSAQGRRPHRPPPRRTMGVLRASGGWVEFHNRICGDREARKAYRLRS